MVDYFSSPPGHPLKGIFVHPHPYFKKKILAGTNSTVSILLGSHGNDFGEQNSIPHKGCHLRRRVPWTRHSAESTWCGELPWSCVTGSKYCYHSHPTAHRCRETPYGTKKSDSAKHTFPLVLSFLCQSTNGQSAEKQHFLIQALVGTKNE